MGIIRTLNDYGDIQKILADLNIVFNIVFLGTSFFSRNIQPVITILLF